MRAHEFIVETRKIGKVSHRQQQGTRGMHKFRDPGGYDRTYELNRAMMAVACTDGELVPVLNAESWSGRYNTAHPYTELEQKMLQKAFQSLGSDWEDLNHGDMRSQEMHDVLTTSPIKAFAGYPKRKNKKK